MDGVGDYARRLASELRVLGHECHLLALSDGRTAEILREAEGTIPALRLPATLPWDARVRAAREYVRAMAPDWISWQVVPYGFDPRGLSFGLGRRLREISGDTPVQIMFHEIWIGAARDALFKHKLVGQVQRGIIGDLLRQLAPRVIHTHMPLYRHLLEKLGHPVGILPLFGNVPLAEADPTWLQRQRPDLAGQADRWVFALFGSIHPEWDVDDFRQRSLAAAEKAGKKVLLVSIGRPGSAGEIKLRHLQQDQNDAWQVLVLGQQPESEISQCLFAADFGIASSPPENVFKSGTVAAMIEHGLHVIVTRAPAIYRSCPTEILTAGMRNIVTDFNLAGLGKTKAGSFLPGIARQFLDDLAAAPATS